MEMDVLDIDLEAGQSRNGSVTEEVMSVVEDKWMGIG